MDKKTTYLINYDVIFTDNSRILQKEIKVKNCYSELQALIKLEVYLRKKYPNFSKMIKNECSEYNEVMNIFNDIFSKNGNNLFKN